MNSETTISVLCLQVYTDHYLPTIPEKFIEGIKIRDFHKVLIGEAWVLFHQ